MDSTWIQWALGIIAGILISLVSFWFVRRRKKKATFAEAWKDSSRLQPEDVLGIRARPDHGFNHYYEPREHDDEIKQRITDGKHVLVTGNPLAGKSRAVFQALLSSEPSCDVTIPQLADVDLEHFAVPGHILELKKQVLLLDDIDKYVGKQNFEHLLRQFVLQDVIVVATCRQGPELEKAQNRLGSEFSSLLDDPIEIPIVLDELAKKVADNAGIEIPDQFDHNIGSLFVRLKAMRDRYAECGDEEKAILHSIKRLYLAGIYEGEEVFSVHRIKRVANGLFDLELKKHQWSTQLDSLQNSGFVVVNKDTLSVEEAYLQEVIGENVPLLDNFDELIGVFNDDPWALYTLGYRADDIAESDLGIATYERFAIRAVRGAIELWGEPAHRTSRALAYDLLGIIHVRLAKVEDFANNCRTAIIAHKEALKIQTSDGFPMQYAQCQNNLGTAYGTLAQVEDKASNCRAAIAAFKEGLGSVSAGTSPLESAQFYNNLGNAHRTLAEVEDQAANCRAAVTVYKEALTTYTIDRHSFNYGMTQSNLGTAYCTLAEVENQAINCRAAIAASEEALKVYKLDKFPMQYATTQLNLGAAYSRLAEVDDKVANCRAAIGAFGEALQVYSVGQFPIQYAMTQNNLGNAYATLAEVEDKVANCRAAKLAYESALEISEIHRMRDWSADFRLNLQLLAAKCENGESAGSP